MNRVIIQKDEKIYLDTNIDYSIYNDTCINIHNNVYFSDGDNFFHFKNNTCKNPTFLEEIDLLINNFKNLFNSCNLVSIPNQTNDIYLEKPNIFSIENKNKLQVELPKNTIIKMNNIPITLTANTFFEIKPNTKFILPEYANLEIISRNNIYNISNKEKIFVTFSKLF